MDQESIYGNHLDEMNRIMEGLVKRIRAGASELKEKNSMEPVEHLKYRIKSEESMREKCRRNNLPETEESALNCLFELSG